MYIITAIRTRNTTVRFRLIIHILLFVVVVLIMYAIVVVKSLRHILLCTVCITDVIPDVCITKSKTGKLIFYL